MNLNQLKDYLHQCESVNILSYEGDIYLMEAMINGHPVLLNDHHTNQPIIFEGIERARDAAHDQGVNSVQLVHKSSFDEMIGVQTSANDRMTLPIH